MNCVIVILILNINIIQYNILLKEPKTYHIHFESEHLSIRPYLLSYLYCLVTDMSS